MAGNAASTTSTWFSTYKQVGHRYLFTLKQRYNLCDFDDWLAFTQRSERSGFSNQPVKYLCNCRARVHLELIDSQRESASRMLSTGRSKQKIGWMIGEPVRLWFRVYQSCFRERERGERKNWSIMKIICVRWIAAARLDDKHAACQRDCLLAGYRRPNKLNKNFHTIKSDYCVAADAASKSLADTKSCKCNVSTSLEPDQLFVVNAANPLMWMKLTSCIGCKQTPRRSLSFHLTTVMAELTSPIVAHCALSAHFDWPMIICRPSCVAHFARGADINQASIRCVPQSVAASVCFSREGYCALGADLSSDLKSTR